MGGQPLGPEGAAANGMVGGNGAPGGGMDPREQAKEYKYKSVLEMQKALAALQIRARTLTTPDDPMLKMQVRLLNAKNVRIA